MVDPRLDVDHFNVRVTKVVQPHHTDPEGGRERGGREEREGGEGGREEREGREGREEREGGEGLYHLHLSLNRNFLT